MKNHSSKSEVNGSHPQSFFAGMLIGGLAGAGAMLLLAPQSGKRTRAKLQVKGVELREQATEAVEDAIGQVRGQAHRITTDVQHKAEALQHRGQDMLDEQVARVSAAVETGKSVIQDLRS